MENTINHSKAKLALAVLTSPTPAFEEIARRRLLGTALLIVALAGTLAAVPVVIAAGRAHSPIALLTLGKCNPVAWLGLYMLYAFAMQKLLRWLGTQIDYVPLLTLMGWSQIALVLVGASQCAAAFASNREDTLARIGDAGTILFSIAYAALMGPAIALLSGAPKARGILSYIVIHIVAYMGFSIYYTNNLVAGFAHALPGIEQSARFFVSLDHMPWLGAAVVGLVIGIWQIGRDLTWSRMRCWVNAAACGLVGLALFGLYWQAVSRNNYVNILAKAQSAYVDGRYTASARYLERVLRASRGNVWLMTDIASMYYLSGDDARSIDYCDRAVRALKQQSVRPDRQTRAILSVYKGIALDASGQYENALSEFRKAANNWPEYREPPIRMAVTYDRLGKYDEAIKAGNRAVLKLGSKSPVVWVALLQAFACEGDSRQARAAMANLAGNDKDLAKRIGSKPGDWRNAVDKLTRKDLEFGLESELAYRPDRTEPPKRKQSGD